MRYQNLKRKALIIHLIKKGCPNNVDHLSDKLGVSCRTIKRDVQELKGMGANIRFCRQRNSYILKEPFDFEKNLTEYF